MKNLNLIKTSTSTIISNYNPQICCFVEDVLYFVDNLNLYNVTVNHVNVVSKLPIENATHPVYLEGTSLNKNVVLCMSGGEIVSCDTINKTTELVGCMEPGIEAADWSPGEDLLAIVTSSFNLVFLGSDLEPLYECELLGSTGEQLVSVGWGKAETQFRGSAGKFVSEALEKVKTYDDGKVRMAWRGDGQLLVVSFSQSEERQMKVVSNEGRLLYHLESTPGLESALCWKPSGGGGLIATTLKLPNKHIVSFFEKNLLRHGGFELIDNCNVEELIWNKEASILAVVLNNKNIVKLFTVNNYHWYHKFTIEVPVNEKVVYIAWDNEHSSTFVILSTNGSSIMHYRWMWRWSTQVSCGASDDDQSWAAVIDGKNLLLTAFKKGIVPPPMSSATIVTDDFINDVGFLQWGGHSAEASSNDLFIHTVSNKIAIYRFNSEVNAYVHDVVLKCSPCTFQVSWTSYDKLIACRCLKSGDYVLSTINILKKDVVDRPLSQCFVAARRIENENQILLWHGKIATLIDIDGNEIHTKPTNSSSVLLGLALRRKWVFSLDSSYCLLVSGENFAKGITSFSITPTHLLATTMQHKLNCWRLNALGEPPAERAVERGSRIVTHIAGTSSVVLQLPRGNLEVIQPRSLTISIIQELLNALQFQKAFLIMRRERLNLNLLYDHNSLNFERNVAHFVTDISDPAYLCNFIAEVGEEDVTRTLYSQFYDENAGSGSKTVENICSLLLNELTSPNLFLPRLSCLVKNKDIENALLLIKQVKDNEKEGETPVVSSNVSLAHLLYLVDVEDLFKIALGTYDLPLVMFIAGKSQKDPKEYVPFLSNLQKMEISYQKFTIDNYLKRYKKALTHLCSCSSRVKECLDYVVKHELYREALQIFSAGTDTWKSVSVLYGAELTRQGKHEEAGVILERAGEMVLAEHAFARAGSWRRQLACAQTQTIAEDQKDALFKSIAETLRNCRRYKELAQFSFDYCGDTAGGVEALLAAHEFDEATRQAHLRGSPELVDTKVRPTIVQLAKEIQESLVVSSQEVAATLRRLAEIKEANAMMGTTGFGDFDGSDTASESSRGSSRISSRSSKNTRKLQRNLMKKDGRFENVALVAFLYDIATRVVAYKSVIRSLNLTLILVDEEGIARDLQTSLIEALKNVESMVKTIWQPAEVSDEHTTSNSAAMAFTAARRQLPGPVQALQPKVLFPPDLHSGLEWQLDLLHSV